MSLIDVKTDMTGIVSKVDATVGDSLAEDDPLVTLEAMKMFIPIGAPTSGKVAEILVSEGDTVTEGDTIARIEA